MSTNTIITAIVVIILAGVAYWVMSISGFGSVMMQGFNAATSTVATSTNNATSGAPSNTPGATQGGTGVPSSATVHSILTESQPHECLYQNVESSQKASATVDIAGGKMYALFSATDSSGVMRNDSFVYDGAYLYVWQQGKNTGTKTRISSLSQLPTIIPGDLTSGAVFGSSIDNVSWDCHAWATDTSKFQIPSGISFTLK